MASIRNFNPVKLFVGVLVSNENLIAGVETELSASFGAVDYRSPVIPFTFTDYYRNASRESGPGIHRTREGDPCLDEKLLPQNVPGEGHLRRSHDALSQRSLRVLPVVIS